MNTVQQAKALLTNKVWHVVAVGTILGSSTSVFQEDQVMNETVAAPAVANLHWLSASKASDDKSDFTNSFYEESLKISLAFNKDSIATTTGMDAVRQVFSFNNDSEENEPKGLKLKLTGESKAFADMGASKFTATYYILGASENKLYLLTPNKLNGAKVVFLLEGK